MKNDTTASAKRFEFRGAAGRVCCSMDKPEDLCEACAARAAASPQATQVKASKAKAVQPGLRASGSGDDADNKDKTRSDIRREAEDAKRSATAAKPVLRTAEQWTRYFASTLFEPALASVICGTPLELPAPDGYALAVASQRAAKATDHEVTASWTKSVQVELGEAYTPYGEPPDPYAIALRAK